MQTSTLSALRHQLLPAAAAIGAAFAAVAFSPATAAAQQPQVAQVSTYDLDLATDGGRRTLEARLQRAARSVCRSGSISITAARHQQDSCVADALSTVRRQVDQIAAARARLRGADANAVLAAAR